MDLSWASIISTDYNRIYAQENCPEFVVARIYSIGGFATVFCDLKIFRIVKNKTYTLA